MFKEVFDQARKELKEEHLQRVKDNKDKMRKEEEAEKQRIIEETEKKENEIKEREKEKLFLLSDKNTILIQDGKLIKNNGYEFNDFLLSQIFHRFNGDLFDLKTAYSGEKYLVKINGENKHLLTFIDRQFYGEKYIINGDSEKKYNEAEKPTQGKQFQCITTKRKFQGLNSNYTHKELTEHLEGLNLVKDKKPHFIYSLVSYMLNGNCQKCYKPYIENFLDTLPNGRKTAWFIWI